MKFNVSKKLRVGVIGATGMVGQRFITLLDNHPFFEVTSIAASSRSAGRSYEEVVGDRWKLPEPMPEYVKPMIIKDAVNVNEIADEVDFVFCAIEWNNDDTMALETAYAMAETPVVSNNKSHRWTPDVPMLVPEINANHLDIIEFQRKRLGTKYGFITVKPNCSIQSYVPLLYPLLKYEPYEVVATTYQAISGAGKTFKEMPEILDNIIPYIGGEEEKSEQEPLKILGTIENGVINKAASPLVTTQCIRVPVTDGHMAAVFVKFRNKPTKEQILADWTSFKGKPQEYELPNAPEQFITYFEEDNRPQTNLDRNIYNGMGITAGRLREDFIYDFKFIGLSHNTLRGAAGGAVLTAELLTAEGYLKNK